MFVRTLGFALVLTTLDTVTPARASQVETATSPATLILAADITSVALMAVAPWSRSRAP